MDQDHKKRLNKNFGLQHIGDEKHPGKAKNDVGAFDQARYHSVRPSGSPKGTRAEGKYEGQTKAVVRDIDTTNTGWDGHGETHSGPYMVTGDKQGKDMYVEHANEPLTSLESGRYRDRRGQEYSECDDSTSAGYRQYTSSQ